MSAVVTPTPSPRPDTFRSSLNTALLVLGGLGVLAVIIAVVVIVLGGGGVPYDPNAPDRSWPG